MDAGHVKEVQKYILLMSGDENHGVRERGRGKVDVCVAIRVNMRRGRRQWLVNEERVGGMANVLGRGC